MEYYFSNLSKEPSEADVLDIDEIDCLVKHTIFCISGGEGWGIDGCVRLATKDDAETWSEYLTTDDIGETFISLVCNEEEIEVSGDLYAIVITDKELETMDTARKLDNFYARCVSVYEDGKSNDDWEYQAHEAFTKFYMKKDTDDDKEYMEWNIDIEKCEDCSNEEQCKHCFENTEWCSCCEKQYSYDYGIKYCSVCENWFCKTCVPLKSFYNQQEDDDDNQVCGGCYNKVNTEPMYAVMTN